MGAGRFGLPFGRIEVAEQRLRAIADYRAALNVVWGPAFNAQNELLDEHSERYDLEDQDWRKKKRYEPSMK